mmetsp:Transcript_49027/g.129861  ORF Transcript_49027/g.129861 Transcript_49027/m.129861 type:complete len:151 (-) Transcript_49027:553-1005(-)
MVAHSVGDIERKSVGGWAVLTNSCFLFPTGQAAERGAPLPEAPGLAARKGAVAHRHPNRMPLPRQRIHGFETESLQHCSRCQQQGVARRLHFKGDAENSGHPENAISGGKRSAHLNLAQRQEEDLVTNSASPDDHELVKLSSVRSQLSAS